MKVTDYHKIRINKISGLISLFCFLFINTIFSQTPDHWETVVFNNDVWKYQIGSPETDPNWRSSSFDDSEWNQGKGGFGFGDNDDTTVIEQCTSVYMRIRFDICDTSSIEYSVLHIDYDDAFVAYLNGVEIARSGITGEYPAYDQKGTNHEANMYRGGDPESFIVNKNKLKSCLVQGENILAVQVHNTSPTSSDMSSNVWYSFGIADQSNNYRPIPDWFVAPAFFTKSNLPIVVIKTSNGEAIQDKTKITADMKIIFNGNGITNNIDDPGNVYSGKIGIEIRGRSSASYPQKPYGFETRDAVGNNLNVALLGMPEENDWILTSNYNDKTFLRNYLAFDLSRKMGHYAPRTRYCEVVINDDYKGIYLLEEKIKVDKNRVNIAKLKPDENSGNDLTGGYIFATDYYTSADSWLSDFSPVNKPGADVYFVYKDPDPETLSITQKAYLKDYVNSFESVLYGNDFEDHQSGYRAYLDVPSFIDYFLLEELARNVDAYKKSRFFYKNKDSKGGLIQSGPVWDFDWAWKDITENCINFNQTDGSGWAYKINECAAWPVPPSWEVRLLQDKNFMNQVHDKYFLLRKNILNETSLNEVIDSVANLLNEAQSRHYQKWKILGINVGTSEYGEQPDTYSGEIEKFKSWISRRLTWLDHNMVGNSYAAYEGYKPIYRIFPNPAQEYLHIESDTMISKVTVFNFMGTPVLEKADIDNYATTIDVSGYKPGVYITRICFARGDVITSRFVKK